MRFTILLALILGIQTPLAAQVVAGQTTASLPGWILGCWEGASGEMRVTERWIEADNALLGVGESSRDGSLLMSEVMRIEPTSAGLVFDALPEGQERARFVASRISARDAVFENPDHDFPQRVHYRASAAGDSLHAVVSSLDSSGPSITIAYRRAACP